MQWTRVFSVMALMLVAVPAFAYRSIVCYTASGERHWLTTNLPCSRIRTGGSHEIACYPASIAAATYSAGYGGERLVGPGGGIQIARTARTSIEIDKHNRLHAFRLNGSGAVTDIFVLADFGPLDAEAEIAIGARVINVPTASNILSPAGITLDSTSIAIEVLIFDPTTRDIRNRRTAVLEEETLAVAQLTELTAPIAIPKRRSVRHP